MKTAPKLLLILLFLLLPVLLLQPWQPVVPARAQDQPTPNPGRKTTQIVNFTWYSWWMVRWENNQAACQIMVEHPGIPYGSEILNACGNLYTNQWKSTQPCANVADPGNCHGMYMHLLGTFPAKRAVEVTLPDPQVWLSLIDCNPDPTPNICTSVPTLLLTGEEPLPNEMIIRIQGTVDGEPFSCPGSMCSLPLKPTGSQGIEVDFWGDSSHGDSTAHFTAQIRVVSKGDFAAPEAASQVDQARWNVDVISTQWRDAPLASCADTWGLFPDSSGPPAWLNTPIKLEDMLSTHSYYYLAGVMIQNHVVDASSCTDGGLASPNVANECGLAAARPQVEDWQNRFDEQIIKVANETGVPGQLLKNIFGRESQFWPGMYSSINEVGLGQLTDKGADTLLLWNKNFFSQFCPTVLSDTACSQGFIYLTTSQQDMLRGALLSQVNASCPQCPMQVDINQAELSVRVFAESLLATCTQTARIVSNLTNKTPAQVTDYVDMWKLTLANYNAGPGCLFTAAEGAIADGLPLTWEKVARHLEPACQPAADYVTSISQGQPVVPTATPWVFQGTPLPPPVYPTAPPYQSPTPIGFGRVPVTPQPSSTPTPTVGATRTLPANATSVPTETPTEAGYPAFPTPTTSGYYP